MTQPRGQISKKLIFYRDTYRIYPEQTKQLKVAVKDLKMEIKERKRTENTLRKSEAKHSTLLENALDGIVIVQDGKLKFVNKVSLELTGYTPEKLIGTNYIEMIMPDYRQKSVKRYQKKRPMPWVLKALL